MVISINKGFTLPDEMRAELAVPIDIIITDAELESIVPRDAVIYAVGDMTVATLLKHAYSPKVVLYDRLIQRKKVSSKKPYSGFRNVEKVSNAPGMLTPALWDAVRRASKNKGSSVIEVIGEEDMASLACIHFAKIGDYCIYGIPGKGMTVVHITKIKKKLVDSMILRLKRVQQRK
jgi:uncharacterized protein (UPF0218 family)